MSHAAASGASTAVAEAPLSDGALRERPVVVTGAAGFVGTHVCRALAASGWKVRALVRDPARAAMRLGHLPLTLRGGDLRDASFVRDSLAGAGSVIHLAAIAIERHGQRYEEINTRVTQDLLAAAREAGAERFLHMSQNGSDSSSPYQFLRSKGAAQDAVTASGLRWTVFRPSVIFGPEDAFANALARVVRLTPAVLPLPGGGSARFQPVHADDVATAVRKALGDDSTIGQVYPLGGPEALSLRDMARRILRAMHASRLIVGVPVAAVRPVAAVGATLLPSPPVTPGLLDLLALDNTISDNAITATFGIEPVRFDERSLGYLRRVTLGEALRSMLGRA